jgi:hypothetical protein
MQSIIDEKTEYFLAFDEIIQTPIFWRLTQKERLLPYLSFSLSSQVEALPSMASRN